MPRSPQPEEPELPLRIVVDQPVPGVLLKLQRGRTDLVEPTAATPAAVVFDFTVRVGPAPAGQPPRFLGPFTQGPPGGRFVYVNVGTYAGQEDTPWARRAKVPLTGITAAQVKAALAKPGAHLEVHFPGRGPDGGPTCATVRLPAGAWEVVTRGG
jgi:hypothetical protein